MADPIKLLDFYIESDHEILFGRGEETKSIVSLLKTYSIVIVSGESGTGKTSLIRAGLIPILLKDTKVIYHRMNSDSRKQLPEKLLSGTSLSSENNKSFETIIKDLLKYFKQESENCIII